jgi:hypothetical protein
VWSDFDIEGPPCSVHCLTRHLGEICFTIES